jgi:PST family polysaccharide transporter
VSAEHSAPPVTHREHPLLHHQVGALGIANVVAMAAPLVVVPYLARVLGAEAWGPVLLAQALAAWVVLLLDFASDLHGARAVGAATTEALAPVVWGVQRGKLLLVGPALLLLAAASWGVPALRAAPLLAAWTAVAAVARGLSPVWAYVALERPRGALLVDTGTRVAAALGVMLVVRTPRDGWLVLALQGAGTAVGTAWLWWRLRTLLPPPTAPGGSLWLQEARQALVRGRTLFAFRALGTVYQQGALLLLGALAPASAVAAYGAADRLVRAALNLLEPLSRALLPRLSRWHVDGAPQWERTVTRLLWWLGVGGWVAAGTVLAIAPWGIALLLGPGYDQAALVLRLLAPVLPLVAVATVLGFYWALPAGRDALLLRGTALAGGINLLLVAVLVPRWGALGMAGAVVAAEAVMVVVLARAYRARAPHGGHGS